MPCEWAWPACCPAITACTTNRKLSTPSTKTKWWTFTPTDIEAELKHIIYKRKNIANTIYGLMTENSYTQVAPQYFGFVSGKVTAGTIDNVKVNNAKINTNGSTAGEFDTSINTIPRIINLFA